MKVKSWTCFKLNMAPYPIKIGLSRKKISRTLKAIIEIILLVMVGFWGFLFLLIWAGGEIRWAEMAWLLIPLAVMIIIGLFAYRAVYRRLYQKCGLMPGLVIDAEGLLDYTARGKPFRIWRKDIAGVAVSWGKERYVGKHYVPRQHLVLIMLKNSTEFIAAEARIHAKLLMWCHLKLHGSPICFNDDVLDISFKDLVKLLETEFGALRLNHKEIMQYGVD